MSGPGRRRPVAFAAALALALAGCLTDAPVPTPGPSPSVEPEPTPVVTTYRLGTTAWYGGLVLTFGTATATLDAKGGPVEVKVRFDNPGQADARLGGPIRLVAGDAVAEPTRETVLPLVPAEGSADALVTFEVDGTFDVVVAAIRVGRDSEHQAIVPLVAGPEAPPVTLEPLMLDVTGTGTAGAIVAELVGVELRADLPDWGQELPREVMALTVTYHATFRSDFVGGAAFTTDNVRLVLPDGTRIAPRRDGHSHRIALLRPNRRNIIATRFEVPAPGDGRYELAVSDGSATVGLAFVIELP
ncbi:MAG: hypothetical protein AB1736_11025 [Chloroflexota bacterium]